MSAHSRTAKRSLHHLRIEHLEDRRVLALMLDIGFDGDGSRTTDFGFGNDSAQAVGFQSGNRIVVGGIADNGANEDFALARYLPDGQLDRTFGINGGIRTDFDGDNERIFGVAVQPGDDKIIAVGTSFFTDSFGIRTSNFAIARFLPDGQPDLNFGNARPGQTFVDFFEGINDDSANDVAVLDNGQILVAGEAFNPVTGNTDFALTRLNADGSVDTSFGVFGLVSVDGFGGNDVAYDMVVQSDGRIILVGTGQFEGDFDIVLMRFDSNGTLDASFFGVGKTRVTFGTGFEAAFAVDLQPDGKIVTAGTVFQEGRGFDFTLLRFSSDGVLDPTFGNGGGVITDFDGGNDAAFSVDILPDGRILATGEAFFFTDLDIALAAYNADGSPDTDRLPGDSKDPPGTVTTHFGHGDDSGVGTFVQNDGSILVVGRALIQTDTDFAVARYSEPRTGPTGNIDSDGDGLLDDWEVNGLDINNDGLVDLDLPALGANPMRRDLFVELDAMVGRTPLPGVIDAVIQSFANAPVNNADGSTGISLHVITDELNLPLVDWPQLAQGFPVGAANLYSTNFGTAAERASGNSANIRAAKALAFRYGVFGNTYNSPPGSSGIARGIPGNMFVVTLGTFQNFGTFSQQSGTLMHEFGHTLGLRHGGGDNINRKPGYFSVMSYSFQWRTQENQAVWRLDYDREATVFDDWGNIRYSLQTDSETAGLTEQTSSIKEVEEPINTSDPLVGALAGTLDVTGGGNTNPFQDGILIVRHMLGQPDANLEDPTLIPAEATRTTGAAIRSHLEAAGDALDANGDGRINPFQDGILIVRYLLGQPDANLEDSALIPAESTRTTGAAIRAHLDMLIPQGTEGELLAGGNGEGEFDALVRTILNRADANSADVNGDGLVTMRDALNVINEVDRDRVDDEIWSRFDANRDRKVSVADALYVINRMADDAVVARVAATDGEDDALDSVDRLLSDGALVGGLF